MADNLYFNQNGYEKMVTKWLSALANPANVGVKIRRAAALSVSRRRFQ
jgi:hypothetical protein